MQYTVIGISSGLGVSLFPFKDNLAFNIETRRIFHIPGDPQWKLNFGNIPLYKKEGMMKMPKDSVDVMISSPDCGSGSVLRYSRAKVLGDHKKNESLAWFFRGIELFNPKTFLFENLENLFKSFPKDEFKELTKNYRLIIHNASVSKWGNSQVTRKRLVIVGIRKDLPRKMDKYFKLPHYEDRIKTCGELYGDLSRKENRNISGNKREDIQEVISIHARRKLSLWEIQRQWWNMPNKKRWLSPGYPFSTAPGVYRNIKDDYPATARKANRQFDHNGLTLTPRQLARIQGVPDEFQLFYDDTKKKYCINKARCVVTKTPPYEISVWFKNKLEKSHKLWK